WPQWGCSFRSGCGRRSGSSNANRCYSARPNRAGAGGRCSGRRRSSRGPRRAFVRRSARVTMPLNLAERPQPSGPPPMPTPKPLETYTSYKGLPQLAGLCTVEEAAKPGLSVEECVRRLKRFHYAFKRLHQILTARITAEPIYELKTGFSHHAYLCAEHVTA